MRHLSTLSFLFALTFAAVASAQTFSPWTWSNPYPVGTDLNAVLAFTDGRVLFFGEGGTSVRSTDAGTTWTSFAYPAGLTRVTAVNFPTESIGYLLGDDVDQVGRIAKTTDGGLTWQLLSYSSFAFLNSVSFPLDDALTGWVSGSGGLVIKTTNGGSSWTAQTTNVVDDLRSIHAWSASKATASANDGKVIETADGGQTWIPMSTGAPGTITQVRYSTSGIMTGIGLGGYVGYRSPDQEGGGWNAVNAGTSTDLYAMTHLSNDVMVVAGDGGVIVRSSGGFAGWTTYSTGLTSRPKRLSFADTSKGWVAGSAGGLARSIDGGRTWIPVSQGNMRSIYDIAAFGGDTVCAVGTLGTIMRRVSRHASWETRSSGVTTTLTAIEVFGNGIAVAVGGGGSILRSQDAGDTWQPISSGLTTTLNGIAQRGTVALIVGASGKILRSTDAGGSWSPVVSGSTAQLRGVAFATDSVVVVTGSSATILRSTNGGVDWGQISSEEARSCNAISFADSLRGTAVGTALDLGLPPPVIRTTDGGVTWTLALLPPSKPVFPATIVMGLWGIQLESDGTGIVVGDEGAAFLTTNGGSTWTRHLIGVNTPIRSADRAEDGHWIVVGNAGSILESTPVPTSVTESFPTFVPTPPLLLPNFPNPFNPSTEIRFYLPQAQRARLTVHDLVGREVAMISDESLPAGYHRRIFTADRLSAGVYFYRFIAGSSVQTGKMILLK